MKLDAPLSNLIQIGAETWSSLEMSTDEKIDIQNQIQESLDEHCTVEQENYIKLEIIKESYKRLIEVCPELEAEITTLINTFNEQAEANELDELPFGTLDELTDKVFVLKMTPEEGEALLKQIKDRDGFVPPDQYKLLTEVIGRKYETGLLEALEHIAPDEVWTWVDQIKQTDTIITDKVFNKAKERAKQ